MWPSDQIERTNAKVGPTSQVSHTTSAGNTIFVPPQFYTIPDALRTGDTVVHDRCIFTGYPRKATASDTSTDSKSAATTGVTSGAAAEDPVELYWIVPKKMGGEVCLLCTATAATPRGFTEVHTTVLERDQASHQGRVVVIEQHLTDVFPRPRAMVHQRAQRRC